MVIRFLRNCQERYFASEDGRKVQRYLSVSLERRIELCSQFDYTCVWEPYHLHEVEKFLSFSKNQDAKNLWGSLRWSEGNASSRAYTICSVGENLVREMRIDERRKVKKKQKII